MVVVCDAEVAVLSGDVSGVSGFLVVCVVGNLFVELCVDFVCCVDTSVGIDGGDLVIIGVVGFCV